MLSGESLIQQQAYIWFNNTYCLKHHEPRCCMFSVPNESENGWEAQKKVNVGLLRGASDTIVLLPGGITLFMECKTQIGVQSQAQIEFQERVTALGFHYYIFRSLSQFQQIISQYISWPKKP
jgi:hypothetical protein